MSAAIWALVRAQHGVITHAQLRERGFSAAAIRRRVAAGRLHPVHRGVYAVGRPELSDLGRWMAAVLAAGAGAVLSHSDAAALWGIWGSGSSRRIEVSVPSGTTIRRPGLRIHRRAAHLIDSADRHRNIPVTNPEQTIIDIAARLTGTELERVINNADAGGLATVARIRAEAADNPWRPGAAKVAALIDRGALRLTRSELERRFLPIARRAGLPEPLTNVGVNGYEVDFHWPELGLVVETDGGRFHRTPFQQTRDRRRDQAHLLAGITAVRFTHAQVRYEAGEVERVLRTVAARS